MHKAVFFDRDGVINIDKGYTYKIEDFLFVDGILDLLEFCNKKSYLLIVITNQSGIARGYYSKDDFLKLSDFMQNTLIEKIGFCFDKIYYCPHSVESNCYCRKPNIGMLKEAIDDFNINPYVSYIIGDKESDIQAGINVGIKTKILFGDKNLISMADYIVDNLCDIKNIII